MYVVEANSARLCVFNDLGEPLLTPKMLNGSQPIHNILHADGGAGSFEEDVQPGDECSYRALPYALWVSLSAELEAAYAKDALSDHAYEDDTDNGDDTASAKAVQRMEYLSKLVPQARLQLPPPTLGTPSAATVVLFIADSKPDPTLLLVWDDLK